MSNNEWIQEGTPRDEEWTAEQDDYGVPVEPSEWDDYASEQTVPVPPAPSQPVPEPAPVEHPVEAVSEWDDDESGAEQAGEPEGFEEAPAAEPEGFEETPAAEPEGFEEAPAAEPEPLVEPAATDETTQAVVEEPEPVPAEEEPEAPQADDAAPAEAEPEAAEELSFGWPVVTEPADEPAAESAEEDPHATQAMPVVVPAPPGHGEGAAAAAGAAAMAGLYRGDRDQTRVIEGTQRQSLDDELAEEERVAHQLRAEKEARDQRLGLVQTSEANAVRHLPQVRRGVGHFGSFGLFVLRLVTAAILGVVGYQILSKFDDTVDFLGGTLLPEPELVAWIVGLGLAVMAVLLVIGLAVRVVGVLLAVVAGGSLAFIRWGQFSPFVAGMEGFLGDKDLLLFAVGILFLSLGGGRWGIDGAFVKARENAREARH